MPLPKPIAKLVEVLKEPAVYVPILLLLLVLVISVSGWLLFGSWLVSVIVALAVALILLMVILLRTVFGEEKEKQLERGIDDVSPTAPARVVGEALSVEESFARALRDIRGSRLGAGGLQSLPWIAVVGETGSGKTELIRQCGLSLPAEFAHRVRGGPTASVDWFLAEEAIVLDTAGRLLDAEDPQSREDFASLVRLVKRTRAKESINGLIVTIPITSLFGRSEAELEEQALALRRRINLMEDILGLLVPVYLVVTKSDLIEGFVETVRSLTPSQPGEAFGWTNDRPHFADAGELVELGLGELRDGIERLLPDLMLREPDPRARRRIFTFPQELDAAVGALARFAHRAFAPSAYDEVPFLRGVYFTSALRQGTTLSPLLSRLGQDWARNTVDGACAEGGVFTRELVQEIVIGDRNLAVPRNAFGPRVRRLIHVTLGCAFAVMAGWWSIAAFQNWSGIRSLRSDATQALQAEDLSYLDALRRNINGQAADLTILRRAGLAGPMRSSLDDARSAFTWAFERNLEAPTKARLEKAVEGSGNRGFEAMAQLAQDVSWIKFRADPSRATRPDLAPYAPISRNESDITAFRDGYDDYLRWADSVDLDEKGRRERDKLKAVANLRLNLTELEDWSRRREKDYPPATYGDVGLSVVDDAEATEVPGAYTRRGWQGIVSGLISSIGVAEGKTSPRVEEFRRGYIARFDESWRDYMMDTPINVTASSDVDGSPYLQLIDQIHQNTGAELPRDGTPPAWIATLRDLRREDAPPTADDEAAEPSRWARYRGALSQVEADVARAREKGDAALKTSMKMAADEPTSFGSVVELVREIVPAEGDPEAAAQLRELLTVPASNAASSVLDSALTELDRRWQDRIVGPYTGRLDTQKMKRLYTPDDGDLTVFTEEALGAFYRDGRPRPVFDGRSLPFGPRFLAWMKGAAELQRTLYASGGGTPALGVRLEGIPTTVIGLGDYKVNRQELRLSCSDAEQDFMYYQGAGSFPFRWTPDCDQLTLRVWAIDREGREIEILPPKERTGPLAFPGFLQEAQRLPGRKLQWRYRFLEPPLELVFQYRLKGGEAILALQHAAPPESMRN